MQKVHSKKLHWSNAQDTSNGDAVQWRNSVAQSQTADGGQNLIFTENKTENTCSFLWF
jgi:hypothetical protein